MTDLSTVLRVLPTLSPTELQQIRGKTGALLSLGGGAAMASTSETVVRLELDYLLDGVIVELRRRGLVSQKFKLPPSLITPAYRQASLEVREHLSEYVGKLTAAENAALGKLCAESLARYLDRGNVPLSPSTMLKNIAKVPTAVDSSFPGYLETGSLSFCWKKKK